MEFNKEKYKVYTWKNWIMLHWILNPGLAINELILGQRVPKISLVDKTTDKPRVERGFIPCPHCDKLHDERTWSTQTGTAFKNWFGIYCTDCGNIIPCLRNAFSVIILAVTFPIWGWFYKSSKAKWLKKQPARFENLNIDHVPNPFGEKSWVKTGLGFGAIMFVTMTFVFPYFDGQPIAGIGVLITIIMWTIGGLTFGYLMKLIMNSKNKKKEVNTALNAKES